MLPLRFALRYLFARNARSVVRRIAWVSVAAVGIPVAAMVILLSVFNGLEGVIEGMYRAFDPDLKVVAAEGKYFSERASERAALRSVEGVAGLSILLEESALAVYEERQRLVTVMGVDSLWQQAIAVGDRIVAGAASLRRGDTQEAIVGQGIAYDLALNLVRERPLHLYAPRRGSISTLLPLDLFTERTVRPAGIYALDAQTDATYLLTSIETARALAGRSDGATAYLVRLRPGADPSRVQRAVQERLGPAFRVENRGEQHASMYRIMRAEKWGIFFISVLVLIIASTSIAGSLSMLIIEKRTDAATLRALGVTTPFLRRLFTWEGLLLGALGTVGGLLLGLLFCWGQQRFGWISIPTQTLLVDRYPVEVRGADLLAITAAYLLVVGSITRITVLGMIRPFIHPAQ